MIRALVTLLGAAGAAALLYLAPEAGDELGNGAWGIALATAAAGFVLGLLYQAGGVRRPGLRVNPWLLLLVALPWILLTVGLVAQTAEPGSNVADWTRDVVPGEALERWAGLVPAFALVSGLLLALGLLEPRVGVRERRDLTPARDDRYVVEPADDPLDADVRGRETFRPEPSPVPTATTGRDAPTVAAPAATGSWSDDDVTDAGRTDADATRVIPAASRPVAPDRGATPGSVARDDADVTRVVPAAPSAGPDADADATRVIPAADRSDRPGAVAGGDEGTIVIRPPGDAGPGPADRRDA